MDNNITSLERVGRCVVKPEKLWVGEDSLTVMPAARAAEFGATENPITEEEVRAAVVHRTKTFLRVLEKSGSVEAVFFRAALTALALACKAAIETEKMLAEQGVDPKYLYFSKAASDCGGLLLICFVTLLASSKNTVPVPALHAAFLAEVLQYVVCTPSFKDIVPVGSPMHTPAPEVLTTFFSTLQTNLIESLPDKMFYLKPQGKVTKKMLLANEFSPDCIVVKAKFLRASRGAVVSLPSSEAPQPWAVLDPSGGDQRAFRETYCSVSGKKITVSLCKESGDIRSSFFASPDCVTVKSINILESNPMHFPVRQARMVFYVILDPVWEPFYEAGTNNPTEKQVRACVKAGFGMPGKVKNIKRWLSLLPEFSGQDLGKEAAKLSEEFYRTIVLLDAIVFLNGNAVYPEYRVDGCGRHFIVGFISITENKLARMLYQPGFAGSNSGGPQPTGMELLHFLAHVTSLVGVPCPLSEKDLPTAHFVETWLRTVFHAQGGIIPLSPLVDVQFAIWLYCLEENLPLICQREAPDSFLQMLSILSQDFGLLQGSTISPHESSMGAQSENPYEGLFLDWELDRNILKLLCMQSLSGAGKGVLLDTLAGTDLHYKAKVKLISRVTKVLKDSSVEAPKDFLTVFRSKFFTEVQENGFVSWQDGDSGKVFIHYGENSVGPGQRVCYVAKGKTRSFYLEVGSSWGSSPKDCNVYYSKFLSNFIHWMDSYVMSHTIIQLHSLGIPVICTQNSYTVQSTEVLRSLVPAYTFGIFRVMERNEVIFKDIYAGGTFKTCYRSSRGKIFFHKKRLRLLSRKLNEDTLQGLKDKSRLLSSPQNF